MKMNEKQQAFAQYLLQQGHTPETTKSYVFQIGIFIANNPNAETLQYKDIVDYFGTPFLQNVSRAYRTAILSSIKRYYDFLVETGVRNDHPCKRFFVIGEKRKEHIIASDYFTSGELELLLSREERYRDLKQKHQVIISLLLFQALTSKEIVNLKISHVDLDKGRIYTRGGNKLSARHLEIHPRQYRILENYIHEGRKKLEIPNEKYDNLILGKLGKPCTVEGINYIIETFKYLFPDRNLNPSTIRQSVIANWLNEKNLPLEQVQLLAGHKWISSTVVYRQAPEDKQREIINKFHPLG
jgi:site-specific recombinase XerD